MQKISRGEKYGYRNMWKSKKGYVANPCNANRYLRERGSHACEDIHYISVADNRYVVSEIILSTMHGCPYQLQSILYTIHGSPGQRGILVHFINF